MTQISSDPLKKALILQHDSMPFFPLVPHVTTFLLGNEQKSKF